MPDQPNVPYGYCHCGCGSKTNVAPRNFYRLGVLKGEPFRFVSGHNAYKADERWVPEDRGFESPCWIWQLEKSRGYGRCRVKGVNRSAYRIEWERANGPIPDGMHIHHRCRQRACVNPDHLTVLPVAEHMREHRATLDVDDVRAIRAELARDSGYGACTRLARRYGVAPKTVNDIKHGRTWVDA